MERLPLLMTRPEGANAVFASRFPPALAAAVEPVECPLMRIRPLNPPVEMPAAAAAIFTSSNGVRLAPPAQGRTAFCVGKRTTDAAAAAGWRSVFAGQTAEELVAHVLKARPGLPLLHFCGTHVRGEVAETLAAEGFDVSRIALYDQDLLPLSARASVLLESKKPLLVPLFSPRAASHFAAQAHAYPDLRLVALSAAVACALPRAAGFHVTTASDPDADAMIAAIEKLVETIRLG